MQVETITNFHPSFTAYILQTHTHTLLQVGKHFYFVLHVKTVQGQKETVFLLVHASHLQSTLGVPTVVEGKEGREFFQE